MRSSQLARMPIASMSTETRMAIATAITSLRWRTDVPLVRSVGNQTIVNPGSVGLPFTDYGFTGEVRVLNRAYAMLDVDGGTVAVELREVPTYREAARCTSETKDTQPTPSIAVPRADRPPPPQSAFLRIWAQISALIYARTGKRAGQLR
jgi:hypothetical protein